MLQFIAISIGAASPSQRIVRICCFKGLSVYVEKLTLPSLIFPQDRDRADAAPDAFTPAKLLSFVTDIKILASCIQFFSATLSTYSLGYFLPTILRSMGFSTAESQVLIAPPHVFCII